METLRFHVTIAALMEELNWLRRHVQHLDDAQRRRAFETQVLLLAPLAPHLAEELWSRLAQPYSVHDQLWPQTSSALLREQTVEIPVQVDGRVRDRIVVPADAGSETIITTALASERVQAALAGGEATRVVVVPGRVVNVVR